MRALVERAGLDDHVLDLPRGEGLVREPEAIYRIRCARTPREEGRDIDVVEPGSIEVQTGELPGEHEIRGLVEAAEVEDVLFAAVISYREKAYADVAKVLDRDQVAVAAREACIIPDVAAAFAVVDVVAISARPRAPRAPPPKRGVPIELLNNLLISLALQDPVIFVAFPCYGSLLPE